MAIGTVLRVRIESTTWLTDTDALVVWVDTWCMKALLANWALDGVCGVVATGDGRWVSDSVDSGGSFVLRRREGGEAQANEEERGLHFGEVRRFGVRRR